MRQVGQDGFTLIELTLAMVLFSFVLLIVVAGFGNIMQVYQDGLASRATQQNTRYGLDDIIDEGHSAYQAQVTGSGNMEQICLVEAGKVVEYQVGADSFLHKLTFPAGSTTCTGTTASDQIISSNSVAVVQLTGQVSGPATYSSTSPQSLTVTLGFAPLSAVTNDLITASDPPQCLPNASYCSVTLLTSTVSLQGTQQ